MTNFDAEIRDKRDLAGRIRESMPRRAEAVFAAASEFASETWENIIREQIERQPDAAVAAGSALSELKSALANLRRESIQLATAALSNALLYDAPDEKLLALVEYPWREESPVCRLPDRRLDDSMRRLLGAIGPALHSAGLQDPMCPVEVTGRYRFSLPAQSASLATAIRLHDESLSSLALALEHVRRVERAKVTAAANNLWDSA